MSVEFGKISDRLGELSQGRAITWLQFRADSKSARHADILWEATPEGQEELKLKFQARGIEKEISAISSLLRIKELEARNTL